MGLHFQQILIFYAVFILLHPSLIADAQLQLKENIMSAPRKDLANNFIDDTGLQNAFNTSQDVFTRLHHDSNTGMTRVSASIVAWFTLAMAAAIGLGALAFFFVELDPQWAGICNGMATLG
ncbi:hypothetical protein IFM89_029986 [Coptis chinensis]|uniref:Uncharacterized protein n=1 Tax=Coptis chinensis TaxID=261450 RepID=A0A835M2E7_9MAGN|nr:hypothetical protein IFM89_029986 [Coptis chinensis]